MRKLFTLLLGLVAFASVEAQVRYSCDFENAAENSNWVLNKTSNSRPLSGFNNLWYLGAAGNCADGSTGLYIAAKSDTTKNAAVSVTGPVDYIVAYRDTLSLGAAGTYILSFDWRAEGKSTDMLSVFWFPSTYTTNTNSNYGAASLPTAWSAYKIGDFRGSPIWQSYYATFTTPTASGKLLFVWYQSGGSVTNPPAAVDNIEILDNSACNPPTNLKYNSSGTLTWQGSASTYDVRYSNTNANTWVVVNGVTGNTCPVTGITEGYYMFQVRSNCGNGSHSKWVSVEQFAYLKGLRCLDFMDLDSTAQCYTGSAQSTNYNAKVTPGKVDHGYASIESQHTIHYLPGETDERTEGGLLTIPDGEVASVRLGNWRDSYGAECIEYKLKVMPGASDILKLKYAVVLEYATWHDSGGAESGSHTSDEQSHFYLSILDAQGHLQDVGCSTFDFAPEPSALSDPTWHLTSNSVMWKEWTEVSISLAKYVGQTITIHLATYDCTGGAHYGYAYFAINCENGQLEGVSCGDYSTDHFSAPEGFKYRWYKQSDPTHTVLDTARVFNISTTDTTVYLVDIINKINNCYYVLTANPNPRFPETNVTYDLYQENCENYVRFHNKSDVVTINRVDSSRTVSEDVLEDVTWDFGDGSPILHSMDSIIDHQYPRKGATYTVRVSASMSGGICTNEQIYTIAVPEAGDWRDEKSETICYGESYTFFGKKLTETGVYIENHGKRVNNCDSLSILDLTVLPELKSSRSDTTICFGDTIRFGKQRITKSGVYSEIFPSKSGCDSTVTWKINVKDPIVPIVSVTPIVEDGDLGAFDITGTGFDYYTINGERHEASETKISGLEPDSYLLIFVNDFGCEKALTFELGQGCVANFVYQRWNYVLSVKNPTYGNGRSYVKYQWIEDGLPIPGATKSYYYADEGLNFDAIYEVQLTDSLGNEYLSCPYKPIQLINNGPSLSPSNTHRGGTVWLHVDEKGWVECYNTSGLKIFAEEVEVGRTALAMPMISGMYIVTVYTESGKESFRVCVTD